MSDMLSAALAYARRGWAVFPCKAGEKTPATAHGCNDATLDGDQIRRWWSQSPTANVGIATGPSRLAVIDLDTKSGTDGPGNWRRLCDELAISDETVSAMTPSGGEHLYFALPDGVTVRNSASKLAPGIDVRALGGYVVAAPSVTALGGYDWQVGHGPDECPVAPLPDALLDLLVSAEAPKSQTPATTGGDRIPEGQRNATLCSMAGVMRRRGMGEEAIVAALLAENATRCDPPLVESEVRDIAASVARYQPGGELERGGGPTMTIEEARLTEAMRRGDKPAIVAFLSERLGLPIRRLLVHESSPVYVELELVSGQMIELGTAHELATESLFCERIMCATLEYPLFRRAQPGQRSEWVFLRQALLAIGEKVAVPGSSERDYVRGLLVDYLENVPPEKWEGVSARATGTLFFVSEIRALIAPDGRIGVSIRDFAEHMRFSRSEPRSERSWAAAFSLLGGRCERIRLGSQQKRFWWFAPETLSQEE